MTPATPATPTAPASEEDPTFEIDFEDTESVVVTVPESEARALIAAIKEAVVQERDGIEITVGVHAHVRITLSPQQMKGLTDNLDYKLRRARLKEVP